MSDTVNLPPFRRESYPANAYYDLKGVGLIYVHRADGGTFDYTPVSESARRSGSPPSRNNRTTNGADLTSAEFLLGPGSNPTFVTRL